MQDKELAIETLIEERQEETVYPLVALRGKVLFPKTFLNFDVGRQASINAYHLNLVLSVMKML